MRDNCVSGTPALSSNAYHLSRKLHLQHYLRFPRDLPLFTHMNYEGCAPFCCQMSKQLSILVLVKITLWCVISQTNSYLYWAFLHHNLSNRIPQRLLLGFLMYQLKLQLSRGMGILSPQSVFSHNIFTYSYYILIYPYIHDCVVLTILFLGAVLRLVIHLEVIALKF